MKLAVAGMRTTCREKVAWRRENFVRKNWAQENCGPLKESTATGIRRAHSVKVTWGKEHGMKRQKHCSNEKPKMTKGGE
jgi:hypothetical protein